MLQCITKIKVFKPQCWQDMAPEKKIDIAQTENKMDNQIMKFLVSNQNSKWFEPKIFFEKQGHNLDFWHLARQLSQLS